MPKDEIFIRTDLAQDLLKIERGLANLSIRINNAIIEEMKLRDKKIDKAKSSRKEFETIFENFDQKANQLYNLLSSVMKAMNEMRMGTSRNLL